MQLDVSGRFNRGRAMLDWPLFREILNSERMTPASTPGTETGQDSERG
jgi:hypothetical protein